MPDMLATIRRLLSARLQAARLAFMSGAPTGLTVSSGLRLLIDSVVHGGFSIESYSQERATWIRTTVTMLGDVTVASGRDCPATLVNRHGQAVAIAMARLEHAQRFITGAASGFFWMRLLLATTTTGAAAAWADTASFLEGQTGLVLASESLGWLAPFLPHAADALVGLLGWLGIDAAVRRGVRAAIRRRIERTIGRL